MRHPLRSLAGQGFWYTLANVLMKLGGLALLPLYADARYLSVGAFGRWGVFEVTVQLAVAILGLQLVAGLLRYYPKAEKPGRVVAAVWWMSVAMMAAASGVAFAGVLFWGDLASRRLYLLLIAYIASELLLAVPLGLLRVRRQAALYTAVSVGKLVLVVGLNLYLLVVLRRGLTGLLEAYTLASGAALLGALLLTRFWRYLWARLEGPLMATLLRFSVPLVFGGLGSMILNAGDRYVLKLLRSNEDLALYTMAAKFGGVVNMFGIQPLLMAFLPILFGLAASQRAEVLRVQMRYLVVGFGLLVVGLSLFAGPVLTLLGADVFYQSSVALIPWIALGFAAFGLSIPFDGVLTLFERTGTVSLWVSTAAVLNLLLNFALVPSLGPLGAAVATFLAYGFLFAVRYYSAHRLLAVAYEWHAIGGILFFTACVSFGGMWIPWPTGLAGWLARSGAVFLWGGLILAFGWFKIEDLQAAWQSLRHNRAA